MTLSPQTAPHTPHDAPVLPEDKAEAAGLWDQVRGTDLAPAFRQVSKDHPDKEVSRTHYQAFLQDVRALFQAPAPVAAPAPIIAAPEPGTPDEPEADLDPTDLNSGSTDLEPGDLEGDGEDVEGDDPAEPEADREDEEEEAPESGGEATPASSAAPAAPTAPVAPPAHSGLISQLAGMLADGGEVTLQIMRLGDQVTIGIFPKPHPGEPGPQPVIVTNTPAYFDEHLVQAMQPYAQARRDTFDVFQAAAAKQAKVTPKAASTPAPPKSKTSQVTLKAAEGTTFAAKLGTQAVELVIGENSVGQGTLEITATHPLYGEVKKTLYTHSAKTHDFTEQQGARVTVNTVPESAAVTATKDDQSLAFHGETLLPSGSWLIEAEAAGHQKKQQRLTVRAGKAQVITLELPVEDLPPLFS